MAVTEPLGGAGVVFLGGSRGQFGAFLGPNTIQANAGGGVSLGERSEISFFGLGGGPANLIVGNGSSGVSVGTGSQASFIEPVQITDHPGPGVDIYANSQANFSGANLVLRNGTGGDPTSAGIRVDGNSEALLRGGTVSQNNGPAILALVNSSVDFTGITFSGNDGIVTCDSSATMVSDIATPNHAPSGVVCRTPHALRNRRVNRPTFKAPDVSAYKALQAKYKKIATRH